MHIILIRPFGIFLDDALEHPQATCIIVEPLVHFVDPKLLLASRVLRATVSLQSTCCMLSKAWLVRSTDPDLEGCVKFCFLLKLR